MTISAATVKKLRDKTNAGMMDCKEALMQSDGDFDKAIEYLRKKGLSAAAKRSSRAAKDGTITAYIHMEGKIGVMVEVNCETDFVARTKEFQDLAHDIAVQVAAMDPRFRSREDVPAELLNREREILSAQLATTDKPENVKKQIVEGRLEKWYTENVFMDQPFVKDDTQKMHEFINNHIAKFGENIVMRRYARFKLGEASE